MRLKFINWMLVAVLFGALMTGCGGAGSDQNITKPVVTDPVDQNTTPIVVDCNNTETYALTMQMDGKKEFVDQGRRMYFEGLSFYSEGGVSTDLNITFQVKSSSKDDKDLKLEELRIFCNGEVISEYEEAKFANGVATVAFEDIIIPDGISTITFSAKGGRSIPGNTVYKILAVQAVNATSQKDENIRVDYSTKINSYPSVMIRGVKIAGVMTDPEISIVNSDRYVTISEIIFDTSRSGEDVEIQKIKFSFDINSSTATYEDIRNCRLSVDNSIFSLSDREDVSQDGNVSFDISLEMSSWEVVTVGLTCELNDNFFSNDTISITGSFQAESDYTDTDVFGNIEKQSDVQIAEDIDLDFNYQLMSKASLVGDEVVVSGYLFGTDNGSQVSKITAKFVNIGNAIAALSVGDEVDLYISGQKVATSTIDSSGNVNFDVAIKVESWVDLEFKTVPARDGLIKIISATVTVDSGSSTTDKSDYIEVQVVNALPVVSIDNFYDDNLSNKDDKILAYYSVKAVGDDVLMKDIVFRYQHRNIRLDNMRVLIFDNENMDGVAEKEISISTQNSSIHAELDHIIQENDEYWVFLVADVTVTADSSYIYISLYHDRYEWDEDSETGVGMMFSDGVSDIDGVLVTDKHHWWDHWNY